MEEIKTQYFYILEIKCVDNFNKLMRFKNICCEHGNMMCCGLQGKHI